MKVDNALVDAHLKEVPSYGTFTTGGLVGVDLELAGGETHRTLYLQALFHSTTLEVSAYLFEVLHITTGEGNANAVNAGFISLEGLAFHVAGHTFEGGSENCSAITGAKLCNSTKA